MPADNSQSVPRTELPPGAEIGRYKVLERISADAHVAVYKCRDPVLDRLVAVKHVPKTAPADLADRCRHEARILARLGSEEPAIATVHELLERDDGLFLVMEYLPGRSLESLMDDNVAPAEPKAALHILWQLAAALHKAHLAGVVHRDIRPESILVTENLRAKIIDFSLASGAGATTTALPGSTRYIAPELLTGRAVDGRADMYSLGFVAYEMLLGRRKFNEVFADVIDGEHGRARRWMDWHGNELLAPPPLHSLVPSVPAALSDIVARMIAKDPNQRFPSMEALARTVRGTFSARRALAAMGATKPVASPLATRAGELAEPPPALSSRGETAKSPPLVLEPPARREEVIPELVAPSAAPAPRRGRGRFALVTVAILAILGAGVALGVRAAIKASHRKQTAADAFNRAMDLYAQGNYQQALGEFSQLRDAYPQEPAAFQASVLVPLCRGQLAMAGDNFSAAAEAHAAAAQQLQAVQAGRVDLKGWAVQANGLLAQYDKLLQAGKAFAEALAEARDQLGSGNFDAVREAISQRLPPLALTPARNAQLVALADELKMAEFSAQFGSHLSAAKALAGSGSMAEADGELAKAGEMLGSPPPNVLTPADLQRLRGQLEAARKALVDERAYQAKVTEADSARQKGDKAAELEALRAAAAIKPSDDLSREIAALTGQVTVQQAAELKAAGKLAEAGSLLQRALETSSDPALQAELADVQRLIRQRALLEAGDKALQNGRLDEALSRYLDADRLGATADTADKLSLARQRVQIAKGDELADARQYAEAAAAYELARKARPAEAGLIDERLATLAKRQQYDQFLAKARAAEAQDNWAEAVRELLKAKAVSDTPEVNERITDARYKQALALGVAAMGRNDYKAARAYFLMAKGFRDTEEAKAMLADAEKKLKGEE